MIKDCTHDYAMAVFSFYAKCGCPTDEEMRVKIRRWAEQHHDSPDVRNKRRHKRLLTEEHLIEEKRREVEQELSVYLNDVAAVNDMLRDVASSSMGEDKLLCIQYIYFDSHTNLKARGSMSALVQRCSMDTGLNESFIYRSLKEAREVFALKRGIRCAAGSVQMAESVFGCAL